MIEITEESERQTLPVGTRFLFDGKPYEITASPERYTCEGCVVYVRGVPPAAPCNKVNCTPQLRGDGNDTILKVVKS